MFKFISYFEVESWNLKSLALGKFQISPISNLIEQLTENVTPVDVDLSFGQIMRKTNMGQSLIDIGKGYITSESSPLGKNKLFSFSFAQINLSFSNGHSIFYIIWYFLVSNNNLHWNSKYDFFSHRNFVFSWLGYFRIHNRKNRTRWTIKRRMHRILQSEVSFHVTHLNKSKNNQLYRK